MRSPAGLGKQEQCGVTNSAEIIGERQQIACDVPGHTSRTIELIERVREDRASGESAGHGSSGSRGLIDGVPQLRIVISGKGERDEQVGQRARNHLIFSGGEIHSPCGGGA
jgi:hypothetical protein